MELKNKLHFLQDLRKFWENMTIKDNHKWWWITEPLLFFQQNCLQTNAAVRRDDRPQKSPFQPCWGALPVQQGTYLIYPWWLHLISLTTEQEKLQNNFQQLS